MSWFWSSEEPKYDSFEYQYKTNPQFKSYYDKYFADDANMKAGESISDKAKILANKMYENEDKVIQKVTETAKKVVGVGQNLALLAICAGGIYVYFKYFNKGAKK